MFIFDNQYITKIVSFDYAPRILSGMRYSERNAVEPKDSA